MNGHSQELIDQLQTRLRDAELARYAAEAQYRSLYEYAPQGIYRSSPEGRFLSVNPAMANMLGYDSPDDLMSSIDNIQHQLYVHPLERDDILNAIHQAGTTAHFETEVYRKDGSTLWASINSRIVYDAQGNVICYEGFAQDITQRKQTEEALRLSEAQFRNIFENSLVGIGRVSTHEGLFLAANQRCAEILGYSSPTDLVYIHRVTDFHTDAGDRQRMLDELYQYGQVRNYELQLRRQDGQLIWGSLSVRLNLQEGCTDFVLADITERKRSEAEREQAEHQLRQQQEVLRTVIDTDPSMIFVKDWDGRYLLANKAAAEFYGTTVEHILGKRDADVHPHPEIAEQFVQENRWVIETGEELFIPEEKVALDGSSEEWVQWQKRPIKLFGSESYSVLGIGVRVTERKRAELALREGQERYATLARVSPVGIFRTDTEGNCQYFNERGCEIIGLKLEETLGKAWIRALHPDDRELVLSEWTRTLETDTPFIAEYRFVRPDGGHIWVLGQAVSEKDSNGTILGYVGTITDITDRKHTEEALQESEAEYRVLVETANCIILRWDADGHIRFINDYGQHFFGYRPSELMGRHVFGTLVPEIETSGRNLGEVIEGIRRHPERYPFIEHENVRHDHTRVWVAWSNQPLYDGSGNLIEILSVGTDATERKAAEEALRRSELKFRNIFENSQVGIYRTRINDGLILEANQRYVELTGYESGEDLIGKRYTHEFYVDLGDRQRMLDLLTEQGSINEFEMMFLQRNGAVRWGMYSLRLNRDENCIEGVVADITDRKRAEKALRLSELKFRNIFENSQVGICRTRPSDGLILEANHRLAEIMGYASPSELIGKRQVSEFYVNPLERRQVVDEVREHGEMRDREIQFFRRDGSLLWGLLSVRPNLDENCFDGVIADISDRKRLEETLRQSQHFLDSIIDNLPLALFTKDIADDFRYVQLNKNSERVLGVSREEAIGKNDYDFVSKEIADYYRLQDMTAVEHGTLTEISEEIIPANATEKIFVRGFKLPLYDGHGNPSHLLCMAEDITERKKREDALRLIVEGTASKTGDEFFQTCVRYLAEVLEVRYALIMEFTNKAKTKVRVLADYNRDTKHRETTEYELHGTPCEDAPIGQVCYYPQNVRHLFPNSPGLIKRQAESYLGIPLANSAGTILGHLAVLDVNPMEDNPGRELILRIFAARAGAELERKQAETALQQEIREREQTMQALRKAEEKFAKAFRASPSPIAITTLPDRRFLDVNRSFLRMSGFSEREVLGHTATELNLGVAQDAYNEAIQTLLETGSLYNQEFKFRTKAGEVRTILLSIEMIDLSGITCALNILNDITERKRLENEFISLVSHELRTPMTSMIGALDLLNSGQLGTLAPQGQRLLDMAISNTERLMRLVNDILDLERMKAGKISMEKARCNLLTLLHQAAESMQSMADSSRVSLIVEAPSIELWVDPDRILQMLTNLLSNAIKFSDSGSRIWLTGESRTGFLDFPSLTDINASFQTLVLITVRDEGRGIPPDKLQSIFEPFQQVDASDSRKKGGTGLGLAICRNIIEQHHGRIWVESTLGQGSTFCVLIPHLGEAETDILDGGAT
ncbi:MAG: PAS domain S-box protein [Elainellaceae cyanobacterium]